MAASPIAAPLVKGTFFSGPFLTNKSAIWALLLMSAMLLAAVWVRGTAGMALMMLVLTALLAGVVCLWRGSMLHVRHSDQAALAGTELVFSAIEQSPESMVVVDFDGHLLYANRTFLERTGYSLPEVLGKPARQISSTGMSEEQRLQMRAVAMGGGVWRSVMVNRRKDGSEMQEGVSISSLMGADGSIQGFVELKQDITELLQSRGRLSQMLNFDALTLLPNRWALSQHLDEMIKSEQGFPHEPEHWHALLLFDMDKFSKFNAGRGLEWGDALLRAVGKRLQSLVPKTAWVARTSGNEFAVVLQDAARSRVDARMMAYALATELQRGLRHVVLAREEMEAVQLAFSVGITVFPFTEPARKRDSEDHIYRRATLALYQAKAQGVGQVHMFYEALEQSSQRKLAIEKGLYEALAHDHLRIFVQKQVDIAGKVRGVEALLRWQPPGEAMVSPGTFIPIAEDSQLIVQLGDWMLRQAVELLTHPLVRGAQMSVAVNISARQFVQADFVDKVTNLLRGKYLGQGRLVLEVTESMVFTNVNEAVQKMTRLNGLGVQCALDDFGTGYSSLSYLNRLPIQEIKIDQSFIHNLEPDANSGTLVQALLMVAKSMHLRVVAEGVETEDQAAILRAWYPAILCQGYLYSRPMPVQEWLEQLSHESLTPP
ncbi:putative bifunctional diguanylate cyclase/phosphodiesterase [Comamonas sp. NoAH]|uniref:putative bifunctional diguanylate cyclase/phosphodiesterase n=1 Tax=Comamonas halotolerans TaxID=3041496 RepID=UPI0024E1833F|nr:GGDEF domain-containing phosphodiesterase [Comamonas sp. NoAH]